jgi:hypothetical protein
METAITLWGRPDFFTVKSNGGANVAAKWLKTPFGSYVIDPTIKGSQQYNNKGVTTIKGSNKGVNKGVIIQ